MEKYNRHKNIAQKNTLMMIFLKTKTPTIEPIKYNQVKWLNRSNTQYIFPSCPKITKITDNIAMICNLFRMPVMIFCLLFFFIFNPLIKAIKFYLDATNLNKINAISKATMIGKIAPTMGG